MVTPASFLGSLGGMELHPGLGPHTSARAGVWLLSVLQDYVRRKEHSLKSHINLVSGTHGFCFCVETTANNMCNRDIYSKVINLEVNLIKVEEYGKEVDFRNMVKKKEILETW